jgi:hypothetical protein
MCSLYVLVKPCRADWENRANGITPQAVINGFFLAGAARSPSRARSGSYLASGSALCDRIFREDLLEPFERPVRGGQRR